MQRILHVLPPLFVPDELFLQFAGVDVHALLQVLLVLPAVPGDHPDDSPVRAVYELHHLFLRREHPEQVGQLQRRHDQDDAAAAHGSDEDDEDDGVAVVEHLLDEAVVDHQHLVQQRPAPVVQRQEHVLQHGVLWLPQRLHHGLVLEHIVHREHVEGHPDVRLQRIRQVGHVVRVQHHRLEKGRVHYLIVPVGSYFLSGYLLLRDEVHEVRVPQGRVGGELRQGLVQVIVGFFQFRYCEFTKIPERHTHVEQPYIEHIRLVDVRVEVQQCHFSVGEAVPAHLLRLQGVDIDHERVLRLHIDYQQHDSGYQQHHEHYGEFDTEPFQRLRQVGEVYGRLEFVDLRVQ